jgi:hypothetical protein
LRRAARIDNVRLAHRILHIGLRRAALPARSGQGLLTSARPDTKLAQYLSFSRILEDPSLSKEKDVKKSWFIALLCAFAAVTAAAQEPSSDAAAIAGSKGKMLVAANGARLGPVYRIGADGAAQIFIDGKLVSIPVTTLSTANGKLTTSLSKSEVLALN